MTTLDLSAMEMGAARAESLLSLLANRHRLMVMCYLIDGEKEEREEKLNPSFNLYFPRSPQAFTFAHSSVLTEPNCKLIRQ